MKKIVVFLSIIFSCNLLPQNCFAKEIEPMKWKDFKATFYRAYGNSKTKTGTKPRNGRTLSVDPKIIPLKSTVEIIYPNGKREIRIAEDTGGKIKKNHVDIFFDAPRKVLLRLGVQKIQIRIISVGES